MSIPVFRGFVTLLLSIPSPALLIRPGIPELRRTKSIGRGRNGRTTWETHVHKRRERGEPIDLVRSREKHGEVKDDDEDAGDAVVEIDRTREIPGIAMKPAVPHFGHVSCIVNQPRKIRRGRRPGSGAAPPPKESVASAIAGSPSLSTVPAYDSASSIGRIVSEEARRRHRWPCRHRHLRVEAASTCGDV